MGELGFMKPRLFGDTLVLSILGLALCVNGSAIAGEAQPDEALQPENVAVVVNADSWASAALANAYVKLRGIPTNNVITVRGLSSFEEIGIDEFRERILTPVLTALDKRGLRGKIDCVAYSADIPYWISFLGETGLGTPRPEIGGAGALTGLTYLYEAVLARSPREYTALNANFYARRPYRVESRSPTHPDEEKANLRDRIVTKRQDLEVQPPRRFRARIAWNARGDSTDAPDGRHYLLSTMLGVTSGRGTSLREAIDILSRAAAADGTRPGGTIYYMINSDIRTATRRWGFDAAIRLLKDAGVTAVIEKGNLPDGRQDIAGAMVGIATFDAAASGIRILPGAICEHLTSGGGVMKWGDGQTPLTEFLRRGAAGASGTVVEPYAIQAKFPDPFIQVHYARGASLAEAFYQSVTGPYQLLIVGDPLCRPWGPPRTNAPAAEPALIELPAAPGPVPADSLARNELVEHGFRVISANGTQMVSGVKDIQSWWQAVAIAPDSRLTISGYIEARTNAVYQFQVQSAEEGKLTVSGHALPSTGHGPWRTYPVDLAPGWHSISLDMKASGTADSPAEPPFKLNFGAVGTQPLIPQLRCAPQRGDQICYVGLSPQVSIPEMTDDPFALTLRFAIDGLQASTSGKLTMRWELPPGSGWSIDPATAQTRVTNGVVEPVPFKVQYRGAPFLTNDFFRLGLCHLQVQTESGAKSANSVGFPLEMILRERPRPQIRAIHATQPPKIDGRLDDDAWSGPATITRFVRSRLDAPRGQPTAAWLAWDDKGLYLAARCAEPQLDRLQLRARQRDASVCADDSIEWFVSFGDEGAKYYQVAVNADGTVYDGIGFDASWNGDYRAATGREEGAWTLEIAAPWATFGVPPPKPGTSLRVLVVRNRHAAQAEEVSTWPVAPGSNHQPRLFGRALIE